MKELIDYYKIRLAEYKKLVENYGDSDKLNYTDTEERGIYLGKAEILEEIIEKLEKL